MAENERKQNRLPVWVRIFIFVFFGILLVIQPWLSGIRWIGWIILALSLLLGVGMMLRLRRAAMVQKEVVAEFASGDTVYAGGVLSDGALYDFTTPGTGLSGADYEEEKGELRLYYTYYGRQRGRTGDTVTLRVGAEEKELAQKVLRHWDLPGIEEALQRQETIKAEHQKKSEV